jgi:hypothetical protein
MELAILSQPAARQRLELIDTFRIGKRTTSWLVMTFVDERRAAVVDAVKVRRIWSHPHQDHGMAAADSKFIPAWRLNPSLWHIFNIGNDVGSAPTASRHYHIIC